MHIKSNPCPKSKPLGRVPSEILLSIPQPHFGENCSQDKGQIPQLSPRGSLQLAGAFHCSLIFFLPLPAFIHSEWLAGPSCVKLSLALGLCTATSFLCLELHRSLPSPLFRSQLKCRHRRPGKAVLARSWAGTVWECIPLKWSSFFTQFHFSWRSLSSFRGERVFYFP